MLEKKTNRCEGKPKETEILLKNIVASFRKTMQN